MDEEIKAAEEAVEASQAEAPQEQSEDNTQVESPITEETPEETTEAELTEEVEEVETVGKKGAQSRIKELAKERDEARKQVQSLADRLSEISGQSDSQEGFPPLPPTYQPGEEVTAEKLSQDVAKTAQAIVDLQIKQNNAVNRINNESRDAVGKYKQLDPDSEEFDPELSESITEATEAYVRLNPYTASPKKFVEKMMKPYLRAVSKEVGKASENIAKQVSQAALRPSSVRKQEKTASEKSIAELEQELGIVQG